MKIWYLDHPLSLYVESKEEIKEIARKNGFRIIHSRYGSNNEVVPKLTLVDATKKRGRKKKEVDEFADQN
jgi:hypothetical protein